MAKTSLRDLLAQRAALEKQIGEFQREQRGAAIAQVKTLMAEYGLTLADIGNSKIAAAAAPAPAPAPRKAAAKKVAAKYRNPATGDSWSGRGLKPKWLVAAIAGGAQITDFKI